MEENAKWGNFNPNKIVLRGDTGTEILFRADSHMDKVISKAKQKIKKKNKNQKRVVKNENI